MILVYILKVIVIAFASLFEAHIYTKRMGYPLTLRGQSGWLLITLDGIDKSGPLDGLAQG